MPVGHPASKHKMESVKERVWTWMEGGVENLGVVGGGEIIIKIYYMKNIF